MVNGTKGLLDEYEYSVVWIVSGMKCLWDVLYGLWYERSSHGTNSLWDEYQWYGKSRHPRGASKRLFRRRSAATAKLVAICRSLAWYGYSVWFVHLPSYLASNVRLASSRLHEAFAILQRMHKLGIQSPDEVCVSNPKYHLACHVSTWCAT